MHTRKNQRFARQKAAVRHPGFGYASRAGNVAAADIFFERELHDRHNNFSRWALYSASLVRRLSTIFGGFLLSEASSFNCASMLAMFLSNCSSSFSIRFRCLSSCAAGTCSTTSNSAVERIDVTLGAATFLNSNFTLESFVIAAACR